MPPRQRPWPSIRSGRQVDGDVGQLQRFLERSRRRRGRLSTITVAPIALAILATAGDIDDFERRVGRAFEESALVFRANGGFPVCEVAAIDERELDAVFRRQRLDHPAAGAEERAGGNDMIMAP